MEKIEVVRTGLFDDVTKADAVKIRTIIDATVKVLDAAEGMTNAAMYKLDLTMSIQAAHTHGSPLRLDDMVEICNKNEVTVNMDMFNVVHDVIGIHNHIDRETGIVDSTFMPRFLVIGS